jgi:hypothetical protein
MSSLLATSSRVMVAVLFCALVALFAPTPLKAQGGAKHGCCAQMQMKVDNTGGCPGHGQPPKKEQDASCCQACSLGLALLYVSPAPFVNAQTGEQSLVSQNARSHALPHQPPVPPPRAALV